MFYKPFLFSVLVLLEASLLVVILVLLPSSIPIFFLLPIFGVGAAEACTGLSVAVLVSRAVPVSCFTIG